MARHPASRRLARSVAALLAVLAVVATAVPAAAATKPKPTSTTAPTPKQWDPRIEPIAHEVEKLRKLDFEHPVAVTFLTDAAFEKKVGIDKGKLSAADKRDAERSQSQLRAVGLIGPDVDLIDANNSLQTSGVLAYYDNATKRITVKGTKLDDIATKVTLAHELTHALQDQHFDLTKLERDATKTHSSTPLRTLVEGDAVRIQNDYVNSLSKQDQDEYQQESNQGSEQAQTEASAAGVPESLSVFFEAPYDLGPVMLDAVIAQRGVAGIDELFAHPPTSDTAYLNPSTLLDGSRFTTVATPKLQAGEQRSGSPDSFGAFALYQVLASRIDPATALAAADGWGGDAMITFTKGGTTCLRSAFVGRDRAATTAIGDALTAWAAAMPAGTAQVQTGGRVTLTACDPGAAGTEAPNRALAALVLAGLRDELFLQGLRANAPTRVAECVSDTLVRDEVFAPILQGLTEHPDVAPDDQQLAAVRARSPQVFRDCSAKGRT
jgi:hypothetical protein